MRRNHIREMVTVGSAVLALLVLATRVEALVDTPTPTATLSFTPAPPLPTHTVTVTPIRCVESVEPSLVLADPHGDSGCFDVVAPGGCCWTAVGGYPGYEATVTSGFEGCGAGRVCYVIGFNNGFDRREVTIEVGDEAFVIRQPRIGTPTPTSTGIVRTPTSRPTAPPREIRCELLLEPPRPRIGERFRVTVSRTSTGLGYPSYTLEPSPLFTGPNGMQHSTTFDLEAVTIGAATLFGSTIDEFIVDYVDGRPIFAFLGASCSGRLEVVLDEEPIVTPTPNATGTPTARMATNDCVGDCDGDGRVRVDELVLGVGILLDDRELSSSISAQASWDLK